MPQLTPTPHPAIASFISTDTPALIRAIARFLGPPIHAGDRRAPPPPTTKFQAQSKPTIDTHDYLTRLITLCPLSIDGVLLGLVYLQRITELSPTSHPKQHAGPGQQRIPINSLTIHRLLLSSMILGTKFISDRPLPRKRLSKVAGVSEIELDHLERELLDRLDFKLCWATDELIRLTQTILTPAPSAPSPSSESSSESSSSESSSSSSVSTTTTTTTATITATKLHTHRASLSTTITSTTVPAPSEINALFRRHSTSKGLVFVKSQFIDSNLLAEKYGFSTEYSRRSASRIVDSLSSNPPINQPTEPAASSCSNPATKPRSTSKIIVTRLEHNQIKICHAQVF
ncbi:hypothetical protein PtA15_5A910 [Puccinia triticina]|uniref:Cyclin N-terminal domain-containing protein n=1 Tax=Puccinia triticina TaxID=208348 RepID=A0ABY7CKW3_9BASI|nr:uncharacterized protein PtA15_5A910 [Puccinia triticina]WAQ85335.1 hypothetical protein PtA15_5A910 [Puccinia triticina]WAR58627.1 hypothetical protein PtB15_5B862 [Puccinia triticina]